MSDRFGAEFELEVLARGARDPGFRRQARRVLQAHEFSDDRYTWLWSLIEGLPGSDLLTAPVVVAAVRRMHPDEEKRRPFIEAALKVLKHTPSAPKRALEELENYRDYHRISAALEASIKLLDKGKVGEAKKKLREVGRSGSDVEYDYTDWFEDFSDRQSRRLELRDHPERRVKIPTRFMPTFDRVTGGGIEIGEVGLIVATTGRGKSMMAANLAFWSAFQNFTTLYVSTEMGKELVATRVDAKWLGISYEKLKYYNLDDDELDLIDAKLDRLNDRLRGKLRIVSIPVRKAKIEVVERALDDLADAGRPVQLLVFDSADHAQPTDRTVNRRDRETQAYWETASLADEYGIPIWSTTHAPKDVVNKVATAENVGESYDKARIADIVLSLNQTKAQAREGILRAFLAKNRQGKGRFVIDLEAKLDQSELTEIAAEEQKEAEADE